MDEIQKRMQDIPSIANMTSARNEFSNLIAQVNQIISFVITGEMGGCDCGDEGCGGKLVALWRRMRPRTLIDKRFAAA